MATYVAICSMTSDFLSEVYGFIHYNKNPTGPSKWVGSVLDVSVDGYYDNAQRLADFEICSKAVAMLSQGKLKCVFLADRSPIHCKYPDGGLNAKVMTVKPKWK